MHLPHVTLLLVLGSLMLLPTTVHVSADKHVQFEEACGGDDTCDKNKGLYCDVEKKICLCSEASSWINDFGTEYSCRVMEGKKCGRSQTSTKCEKGLYCESVKEGDLAETICKCPADKVCTESRRGASDGDKQKNSLGKKILPTSFAGYLTIVLHFIYLRYF